MQLRDADLLQLEVARSELAGESWVLDAPLHLPVQSGRAIKPKRLGWRCMACRPAGCSAAPSRTQHIEVRQVADGKLHVEAATVAGHAVQTHVGMRRMDEGLCQGNAV